MIIPERIHLKATDFDSLVSKARELGAVEAKIIPAGEIVVEDRAVLKCKIGCDDYGTKLSCPPYVPSVDEFRKILKDYSYALFLKFKSESETSEEIAKSLFKYVYDPDAPKDCKEKAQKFCSDWADDAKRILLSILELEKTAFNEGYTFAVGFTAGSCVLCKNCNVATKICAHPTMMRYSEHSVGVNVKKTAKKAGISINFPIKGRPEPTGLILID